MKPQKIRGNIVDVQYRKIFFGELTIENGKIKSIIPIEGEGSDFIMPGFIDSHIHIESSMLVPSEFARLAVVHGTVGSVSDPHEIANVLGVEGVKYMIENGKQTPFKFNFGAPSCVPATSFETAGAELGAKEIEELLSSDDIKYMAEMMNYPGVIFGDPVVLEKLALAKKYKKPIDGHIPGIQGDDLKTYVEKGGISTDHECFTIDEALAKIDLGMKVLIREGSAARNFDSLVDLFHDHKDMIMVCSDDKHPDDLEESHINALAKRAISAGHDVFDVLQVTCLNPINHYNLDIGALKQGDPADFIVVDNLKDFNVKSTYIDGVIVALNGVSLIERTKIKPANNFNIGFRTEDDFKLEPKGEFIKVIKAMDGELITESFIHPVKIDNNNAISNPDADILKIVVLNRYLDAPPAIGFIQGFDIKNGAIASCVGHDSHNIIAVGTSDKSICDAINSIIKNKGGISALHNDKMIELPLPIAGIMSDDDAYIVSKKYSDIDSFVRTIMGSKLRAPFMTLSFMALLVIPRLKLGDKGLFDGTKFEFTSLFSDNMALLKNI